MTRRGICAVDRCYRSYNPGWSLIVLIPSRHTCSPISAFTKCNSAVFGVVDDRAPVILIGYNFKAFDFPRILRAVDRVRLNAPFQDQVVGGVDTLPIFKLIYPEQTIL
jgi:hypothetical protein